MKSSTHSALWWPLLILGVAALVLTACAAPADSSSSEGASLEQVQSETTVTPVEPVAPSAVATVTVIRGSILERDIIPQLQEAFALSDAEVKASLTAAESTLLISDELTDFRRMEGMIPPGEYAIYEGTTLDELIAQWVASSEERYESLEASVEQGNDLTAAERLSLAAMVEAECLTGTHREETTALFLKRLAEGWKLQSCVTAEYILGYQRPFLLLADIAVESGYNTYYTTGLPVGPICSVSDESLQAAIEQSADGDAYYFYYDYVDRDMYFFSDYGEFLAASKATKARFEAESPVGLRDKINKQELYQ